jgi:predicted RNA-binding protein YlqC (UPF0109 family)
MTKPTLDVAAFLTDVLTPMLDQPEAFKVEVKTEGKKVEALLHAAPGDIGRIIGKSGRMISSLRTLVQAAGEKHRLNVTLEIHEEDRKPRAPREAEA